MTEKNAESSKQTRDLGDEDVTDAGSAVDNIKMILTVTMVTCLSAGLLGMVYEQTRGPIEAARKNELARALGYILPAFDNQPLEASRPLQTADTKCEQTIYRATEGGAPVGYALSTCTTKGFGPMIDLLVGTTPMGKVTGVYVLSHQETPGLGAKITEAQKEFPSWREQCASAQCAGNSPFLKQFANRLRGTSSFTVTQDGGEIESITASTISSRAVSDAVAEAIDLILKEQRKAGAQ